MKIRATLLFSLLIPLSALTAFSAETFTDSNMKPFVAGLQKGEYEPALKILMKGSSIEEKVFGVKQTKDNWIDQFKTIRNAYGDYVGFEKVGEMEVGKLRKLYYLIYCRSFAIQATAMVYDNGTRETLVNFEYDDKLGDFMNTIQLLRFEPNP